MSKIKKYCLILEDSQDLRKSHYRFDQGSELIFACGPSLNYHKVSLYTNHPVKNSEFNRNIFHLVPFRYVPSNGPFKIDEKPVNFIATIQTNIPGAYIFYLVDESSNEKNELVSSLMKNNTPLPKEILCLGCFVIDPKIRVINGVNLNLEQIMIQTVLSSCLGPLGEWWDRLKVTYECGFNSIHFTPYQEYGGSGSCFSIKDHFTIDPSISTRVGKDSFETVIKQLKTKFHCLIVDAVLNHTSSDSSLINSHPESYYNLENTPHLRPAFIVDRALFYVTLNIVKHQGTLFKISNQSDLKRIESFIRNEALAKVRLIEFYVVDIEKAVAGFLEYLKEGKYKNIKHKKINLYIIQDKKYQRLGCKIDYECAFNKFIGNANDMTSEQINFACVSLRENLRNLNQAKYEYINEIQNEIINNTIAQISYHFLDDKGPKRYTVSLEDPLIVPYFSICINNYKAVSIEMDETFMNGLNSKYIVAHQGWVINSPVSNFCSPESEVYIRRHLIAWGDCAKIRWGESREDSSYIWDHMEKYIEILATHFDGLRIDNCHSTPIHVLEYIVDYCRKINPNIIFIGELFTQSENDDNLFVNRIGLTCLIRERMSAPDLKELCHIVHRFGGDSVGSFFKQEDIIFCRPTIARAILMDMTHDNHCIYSKFSPLEYSSTLGFVAMANCPIGSVRGFDELIPFHIPVTEKRHYMAWQAESEIKLVNNKHKYSLPLEKTTKVNQETGIIKLRKSLNKFHQKLETTGFNEIYIDQKSNNIVTVTRYNPHLASGYVFVANHAIEFLPHEMVPKYDHDKQNLYLPSTDWKYPEIIIPGLVDEIFLEAYIFQVDNSPIADDKVTIVTVGNFEVEMRTNIKIVDSKMINFRTSCDSDASNTKSHIGLSNFPPGSIIIFKVSQHNKTLDNIKSIKSIIGNISTESNKIFERKPSIYDSFLKEITLADINSLLFKCKEEEIEDGVFSLYNLPNYGYFIYQGLYGIETVLSKCRTTNDLGHPIFQNLRDGNWLIDHIINRIKGHNHPELAKLIESPITICKDLPRFMIPSFFDISIKAIINLLVNFSFTKMNMKFYKHDNFCRRLVLGSLVLIGNSRNVKPPRVHHTVLKKLPHYVNTSITISAGLTHFFGSWSRVWGRDIFISLPGLLLIPGRIEETKFTILSIASTVRHGLIPNLISSLGSSPRYNARDATWFFFHAIKEYIIMTHDYSILTETIYKIFKTDDAPANLVDEESTTNLEEIIVDIIQRHYNKIDFIERDAGQNIDSCMKQEGFKITCGIDHDTGFVYGGNRWNCGTWMDKMGSSEISQNKGFPATPRDGSCIELVALLSSTLSWLQDLSTKNKLQSKGVYDKNKKLITWQHLNKLIELNFEKYFWIPIDINEAREKFHQETEYIHRTGIYKDTINSSLKYTDYQFRPNFLIAMVVAPNLFKPLNAIHALLTTHQVLEGMYGMATLDSNDWNYFGYYNNNDNSDQFNIGGGFNYHQGPEWLWLTGFYLRALLHFSKLKEGHQFIPIIRSMLSRLYSLEQSNEWLGLPELTQEDGILCMDSCRIQAWSIGCIIEALRDFYSPQPVHST